MIGVEARGDVAELSCSTRLVANQASAIFRLLSNVVKTQVVLMYVEAL